MENVGQTTGLIIIALAYVGLGVMVVLGSISVTRKIFSPRAEQIFYALILIPIAAFYWAFVAYFESSRALVLESSAIILFTALALAGLKNVWVLCLGYVLHGLWDGVHEVAAHFSLAVTDSLEITEIPLAYGIACAAYDIGIAFYFLSRKKAWQQAAVAKPAAAS